MTDDRSTYVSRVKRRVLENGVGSTIERGLRFRVLYPVLQRYVDRYAISRSELESIAADRDAIWYEPAEAPIDVEGPDEEDLHRAFGVYRKRFDPDRPFVCELEDCTILDPHGIAVAPDGRLVLETLDHGVHEFVTLERYIGTRNRFLKDRLGRGRPNDGIVRRPVVPCICSDPSYYHWITEYLPKLKRIEWYEDHTGREPLLLVESDPSSFVRETLELAGFGPNRWLTSDELGAARVETLVVPIHRSHFFNHITPSQSYYAPSREDLTWVRNRMWEAVGPAATSEQPATNGTADDRIYVSRQEASLGRRVENYDEFAALLEDRGFEIYLLEKLPFSEQVRLFSKASVVMGPIGAGLVNAIFAEDPLLIELLPTSKLVPEPELVPHFYYLAEVMGFEYEPILTEGRGENLVVDIEAFRRRLDDVLER